MIKCAFYGLLPLSPVCEEPFESNIRERVFQELLEYLVGHGRDVCPHSGGLDYVERVPDARYEHFRFYIVVVEYLYDVTHHLHAELRYVVEPADERAYVGGPGLRREERL